MRLKNSSGNEDSLILSVVYLGQPTQHLLVRVGSKEYSINNTPIPAASLDEVSRLFSSPSV